MEAINEQQVVRFLLGDLSEEQRTKVEERIFSEDSFYKQVLAVQEELADDYVQKKLSRNHRAQFEEYFLQSPIRRERVKFATAFAAALERFDPPAGVTLSTLTFWRSLFSLMNPITGRVAMGAAAASLALLAGTIWLVIENRQLSREVKLASLERKSLLERVQSNEIEAEQREQALEREIAALRAAEVDMEREIRLKQNELEELRQTRRSERISGERSQGIVAFILTPGLTRGIDEPEKLIIPLTSRVIQLQLDRETEEDYESYMVEVRTTRGNLVFAKSGLKMKRTGYAYAVPVTIPANLLSNGEYELALKGAALNRLEAVGYYYFIALNR